jgi:hypothetical protein
MGKVYDLVVSVGSYQKDGETKKRYKNVGVVMECMSCWNAHSTPLDARMIKDLKRF